MFELALRTTAILLVAWIVARMLARATAATRHLVWHSAILAVLVAPVAGPLAPRFDLPAAAALVSVARVPGVANGAAANAAGTPALPRQASASSVTRAPAARNRRRTSAAGAESYEAHRDGGDQQQGGTGGITIHFFRSKGHNFDRDMMLPKHSLGPAPVVRPLPPKRSIRTADRRRGYDWNRFLAQHCKQESCVNGRPVYKISPKNRLCLES